MTLEEIVKAIKQGAGTPKPVLIAVDGFGGSGKTTFAEKLKEALQDAYVVNIDDFIVKEKLQENSWDKGAFDRGRLEKQVLIPATNGQPSSYQKLIWESGGLSEPVKIPAVKYLVIEGISTTHPDIAHYFDCKIWIDAPINVAKERGRARDGSNENAVHWDLWAENDLAYQAKYHPEKRADLYLKMPDLLNSQNRDKILILE